MKKDFTQVTMSRGAITEQLVSMLKGRADSYVPQLEVLRGQLPVDAANSSDTIEFGRVDRPDTGYAPILIEKRENEPDKYQRIGLVVQCQMYKAINDLIEVLCCGAGIQVIRPEQEVYSLMEALMTHLYIGDTETFIGRIEKLKRLLNKHQETDISMEKHIRIELNIGLNFIDIHLREPEGGVYHEDIWTGPADIALHVVELILEAPGKIN